MDNISTFSPSSSPTITHQFDQMKNHLLGRYSVQTNELIAKHPPELYHKNKIYLNDLIIAHEKLNSNQESSIIHYSRWFQMKADRSFSVLHPETHQLISPADELFLCKEDVFDYKLEPDMPTNNAMEWWANFAHSILFVAYGGGLFAQDEMQVAEHPSLGSLREALRTTKDESLRPLTRDAQSGKATPILIRGIERKCHVKTDSNVDEGRPGGLYGNRFAYASEETIKKATEFLSPPTITNMFAFEAPHGGHGIYNMRDINDIFFTAFTAFSAARFESNIAIFGSQIMENHKSCKVVIHTGNWGTGAYGGNKVLMLLLQMLAGRIALVDRVVFHTFNSEGTDAYHKAIQIYKDLIENGEGTKSLPHILETIWSMKFKWGVSDGN